MQPVAPPEATSPAVSVGTATFTEATRTINGVQFHYIIGQPAPHDPALPPRRALLLHGWGGSIESWRPVTANLVERGFQVVVVDFPGFGRSSPPPGAWGVSDYTETLIALIESLAFAPSNIIAHSFGGRVALVLAATRPDLVKRLVLVSAAGIRTDAPSSLRRTATKLGKAVFSLPGLAGIGEQIRARVASKDYLEAGILRETFVKVIEQDLREYAARITRPTLLVWGDQDTETPLEQARILESLIADSGLVILYGSGHFAYLEQLPRFTRILAEFLKD